MIAVMLTAAAAVLAIAAAVMLELHDAAARRLADRESELDARAAALSRRAAGLAERDRILAFWEQVCLPPSPGPAAAGRPA